MLWVWSIMFRKQFPGIYSFPCIVGIGWAHISLQKWGFDLWNPSSHIQFLCQWAIRIALLSTLSTTTSHRAARTLAPPCRSASARGPLDALPVGARGPPGQATVSASTSTWITISRGSPTPSCWGARWPCRIPDCGYRTSNSAAATTRTSKLRR